MLSFVAVDLLSGRITADLIDLTMSAPMKLTMGRYETVQATLPLDGAPSNWRTATRPYSSAIVCLNDDAAKTPVWGSIVNGRDTDESENVVLSMVTAEEYLTRRFVGDQTFTARPQDLLVSDLVTAYVQTGTKPGLPIRVEIDGGNGVNRTISYKDADDKTVESVLSALSGIIGGPEWTIDWENAGGLITPVFRISDQLGSPPPAGVGPGAWFNLPGAINKFKLSETYKSQDGANDVMAVSSGTQGARPQSTHHTFTADNRPTVEYRWTPSTSITDPNTLEGHAQRALAAMQRGGAAMTMTANRYEAPKLGTDWRLGDTIGFDITAPAYPNGFKGTARVIGWELAETEVTPILLVDPSVLDAIDDQLETPQQAYDDGTYVRSGETDNLDGTWTGAPALDFANGTFAI